MTSSSLESTIALIISAASVCVTAWFARQALQISRQQAAGNEPKFGMRLNESVALRSSTAGARVLAFHVVVTNSSDQPTSVISADLHITYTVDGHITVVRVPHDENIETQSPMGGVTFALPVSLDPHGATSGWFRFLVSDQLTGGRPVERYDMVVRDVHDLSQSVQVTVFRETSP